MLWGLGVILLILYLYTSDAKGNQENTVNILNNSVISLADPITLTGNWPKPRITFSGAGCVKYLRDRNYYVPQNPRIWAKYLPVKTLALPPEGVVIVAKTAYGLNGHVSALVNRGGTLYIVADSVLPVGSEVPIGRYLGQV